MLKTKETGETTSNLYRELVQMNGRTGTGMDDLKANLTKNYIKKLWRALFAYDLEGQVT